MDSLMHQRDLEKKTLTDGFYQLLGCRVNNDRRWFDYLFRRKDCSMIDFLARI